MPDPAEVTVNDLVDQMVQRLYEEKLLPNDLNSFEMDQVRLACQAQILGHRSLRVNQNYILRRQVGSRDLGSNRIYELLQKLSPVRDDEIVT